MLQADKGNCILIVAIPQRQLIYGRSAEMAVFCFSSPVGEAAAALEIRVDIESNGDDEHLRLGWAVAAAKVHLSHPTRACPSRASTWSKSDKSDFDGER